MFRFHQRVFLRDTDCQSRCLYLSSRIRNLLANQILNAFNDRIGEKSNQHRVEGENSGDLSCVHLLIFVLQADHGHPADNQASKLEVGEVANACCCVFCHGESSRAPMSPIPSKRPFPNNLKISTRSC